MAVTLQSRIQLNNGVEMPVLGLGVWNIAAGRATQAAVRNALESGYRLRDRSPSVSGCAEPP
ncbi:MAG TPA: hypothetical protein VJN63_02490 [Thermoplasmata archaeon]|nr:hypothetical protein [Thermoplasmata archaeon]